MTGRKTALYRAFSSQGELLYIGVTGNFAKRWNQHASSKSWWPDSRELVTIEWFDSRFDALAAERAAIKAEKPLHNRPARERAPRVPRSTQGGPGRPAIGGEAINVRLGDELPRVDLWALEHGVKRATALRLLLTRGLICAGQVPPDSWRSMTGADRRNWERIYGSHPEPETGRTP